MRDPLEIQDPDEWKGMRRYLSEFLNQQSSTDHQRFLTRLDEYVQEATLVKRLTNDELADALEIIRLDIPQTHDVLITEIIARLKTKETEPTDPNHHE